MTPETQPTAKLLPCPPELEKFFSQCIGMPTALRQDIIERYTRTPPAIRDEDKARALIALNNFDKLSCKFGTDCRSYADAIAWLLENIETIRAALAPAAVTENEPVAWQVATNGDNWGVCTTNDGFESGILKAWKSEPNWKIRPLYAAPVTDISDKFLATLKKQINDANDIHEEIQQYENRDYCKKGAI